MTEIIQFILLFKNIQDANSQNRENLMSNSLRCRRWNEAQSNNTMMSENTPRHNLPKPILGNISKNLRVWPLLGKRVTFILYYISCSFCDIFLKFCFELLTQSLWSYVEGQAVVYGCVLQLCVNNFALWMFLKKKLAILNL